MKNIAEGIPPRGFRFDAAPVKLLIVAKNPGHLLGGERDRYRGLTGTALFAAYREFQRSYYADPDSISEPSNRFHKNLFRYLRYFLNLPADAPPEAIYRYAAHTNLVKCSTPNEQARIRSKVKRECFRKYFVSEIKILQPRVLLALGRSTERFLKSVQHVHNRPVVYMKHPSYPYAREREAGILAGIKTEIIRYFD